MLETRLRTFADNTGGGGGTAFTVPLIASSGGTGTTSIGSATTLVGINSSGLVYDFYLLRASDNATVVRSGTGYFISALTNSASGSGASTANTYVVTDFTTDLSSEFRLVQSGNSITISTAGNLIVINAITSGGAGGTDRAVIGQGVTGTSATRYGAPFGSILDAASANVTQFMMPYTGSARNLYFRIQNTAGATGSARGWNGQVLNGNLMTALTCQIFELQFAASDLTNIISINSGDTISFGYERIGTTATPGNWAISFEFYK